MRQEIPDATYQLVQVEWFRHVLIGSYVEASFSIFRQCARAEHQYRLVPTLLPQRLADNIPTHAWQHEVKNQQVDLVRRTLDQIQGRRAVFGVGDPVAFGLQVELNPYRQMLFVVVAGRLKLQPPLAPLFQAENRRPGTGFSELIEEAKQLELFYAAGEHLLRSYRHGQYAAGWYWCKESITAISGEGWRTEMGRSIRSYPGDSANADNALAAAYDTYQIHGAG